MQVIELHHDAATSKFPSVGSLEGGRRYPEIFHGMEKRRM
jgi:hypothetical protein